MTDLDNGTATVVEQITLFIIDFSLDILQPSPHPYHLQKISCYFDERKTLCNFIFQ